MRIASSALTLSSEHQLQRTSSQEERLVAWVGDPPGAAQAPADGALAPQSASPQAQAQAQGLAAGDGSQLSARHQVDLLILVKAFRIDLSAAILAGDAIAQGYADGQRQAALSARAGTAPGPAASAPEATPSQGWGLELDVTRTDTERESTRTTACGEVTTADGRRLAVDLSVLQERTSSTTASVSLRAGDRRAVDPIALALDGGAPTFAGTQVFDLDADGAAEQVARLGAGSAWLARDLDGDGRVGSGRELFGPTSGDGYAELRALDADGNGWLDEADPAFADLRLWSPAAGPALATLAQRRVGAISLAAAASPFEVAGAVGEAQAQARVAATGLFLREDGSAGVVQELDLYA